MFSLRGLSSKVACQLLYTNISCMCLQINESKTPISASRMHRSNFQSVYSPAIVPRNAGPKVREAEDILYLQEYEVNFITNVSQTML